MGLLLAFLKALTAPSRTRHPKQRPAIFCSNTILHHKPKRLRRVYYWSHRPMCRRCYQHYCKNIRVTRW